MDKRQNKTEKGKPSQRINQFAKYSALGIQMGVLIAAGALLGKYLDGKSERDFPLWTIILSLTAIFAALYLVLKDVLSSNSRK